jgi:hypothetical protein
MSMTTGEGGNFVLCPGAAYGGQGSGGDALDGEGGAASGAKVALAEELEGVGDGTHKERLVLGPLRRPPLARALRKAGEQRAIAHAPHTQVLLVLGC